MRPNPIGDTVWLFDKLPSYYVIHLGPTVFLQTKCMILFHRLKEYSTKTLSKHCRLSSLEAINNFQWNIVSVNIFIIFYVSHNATPLSFQLLLKGGLSAWSCFPLSARVPVPLSPFNALFSPSSDLLVWSKPLNPYTLLISLSSRTPPGGLNSGASQRIKPR